MKKILFIILSFFIIFVSSSFITKAAVSNDSINIYTYDFFNSDEENSLDPSSKYFLKNEITIEDTEGNYTFTTKECSGWTFKGYYQLIDGNYIYYNPDDTININNLTNYDFYEYWEIGPGFTFYIYYMLNESPQEYHIDNFSLDYATFVANFPTTYKNLNAISFSNSEGIKTNIDELYDIYVNAPMEENSSHTIYAKYEVINDNEIIDDIEEEKTIIETWKELDFEIKLIVLIIFLLIILMFLSIFSRKRWYKRW